MDHVCGEHEPCGHTVSRAICLEVRWLGTVRQAGVMSHGQDHEHDHQHLEELHTVWLAARRAWRVSLRVHLEVEHDWAGRGDPERVHRDLHNRD